METVRQIMIRSSGDDWVLRGKTGSAGRVKPRLGWFVGWVERDGKPDVVFATLVLSDERGRGQTALEISGKLLRLMGEVPEQDE
jgi:beta-lactamase class D